MVWHIHQTILIIGLLYETGVLLDRNPLGKLYQNLWITSSSYCKAQRQLLYVLSIELHLWNKLNNYVILFFYGVFHVAFRQAPGMEF